MTAKGPFQLKAFYDSMNIAFIAGHCGQRSCIGSIVYGSQKFIISLLSFTLSVKILISGTPEAYS